MAWAQAPLLFTMSGLAVAPQSSGITRAAKKIVEAGGIAIIGAGLLTAYTLSAWPDLVAGLGIAGPNTMQRGKFRQRRGRNVTQCRLGSYFLGGGPVRRSKLGLVDPKIYGASENHIHVLPISRQG
jgi:hypothetical protein